jgi:hypothetical protein
MRRRSALPLALVLVVGCGGEHEGADGGLNCELDVRGETFAAGMSRAGASGYVFTLDDAVPSPPDRFENEWTVTVTDANGAGAAGLAVLPCMPDHGHGTPIVPSIEGDDAGHFTVSGINLWMPGLWKIMLYATDGSGFETGTCASPSTTAPLDEVVFRFCIDG